ncbi:hypothetical protein [Streptomyces sp. NPDC007074]|uniref:hypothetical protein n=1 Tax=Streptomyces sp. NPDC007074 TaxID=3156764 RepID=UPI003408598B
MDAAITSWLLGQLGTATDVSDLNGRYMRLGTARAVALEVLYERRAALVQQPATVAVPNAVSVGFAENIKALERQIAGLEAGTPPAPDDPSDGGDTDTTHLRVLYLRERPRR